MPVRTSAVALAKSHPAGSSLAALTNADRHRKGRVGPVLLAADRTRRGVADLTAGCIYPEQTGRGGATVITGAGAVPCRKDCPGCFGACCCTGSRGGRPVHDRGLGSGSAGNRLSGAG